MAHVAAWVISGMLLVGLASIVRRIPVEKARTLWLFCFVLVLVTGITAMVAHSFVARWGIRTGVERDGLPAMMAGTAERPFVYRRLAPDAIRWATNFVSTRLPARKVDARLKTSTLLWIYRSQPLSRDDEIAIHCAVILVWLALLGTVIAGADLARAVTGSSWLEALVSASLAIALVPVTLGNGGYVYDSVELLCFTVLVLCIVRGWLVAVIPVFILFLINKESALASVPVLFPLFAARSSRKSAALWTGVLATLALGWVWFVRQHYAQNGGSTQEWALGSNLSFWSHPSSYFKLATLYAPGLLSPRGGNVVILLLLFLPIRFGWPTLMPAVKQATLIAAVCMIPLFLLSGCMDETRALGPLFPLLFVAGLHGLKVLFEDRSFNPSAV